MSFIDESRIKAIAGRGGNGCVSFLREKYNPRGGPNGGNGGEGGDVEAVADPSFSDLEHIRGRTTWKAKAGGAGSGDNRIGGKGEGQIIPVPPGTLIKTEDGDILADLKVPGDRYIIARGGRGGRGNASYASSKNRSPRQADPGAPGDELFVILELRLLADVGIVGFPNAGKSTLLAALSSAKPEIASYPFTTLTPQLGVVQSPDGRRITLADIPGLIEGASEGKGLGHRFLRHISRCKILLFMLEAGGNKTPVSDLEVLREEISTYNRGLLEIPQLIAINKIDLPAAEESVKAITEHCASIGLPVFPISARSLEGVSSLLDAIFDITLEND